MTGSPDTKFRNLEDFAGIASDWFWETDEEHRFTYFSSRMEEVTKLRPDDILGTRRDAISSARAAETKWRDHLADLNAHRPFRNFEYVIERHTDGSKLWMRIAGQPLFDKAGRFIGYRGTGHDITDEKEAMRRLVETNAALADRNRELDETRKALERTANEDLLTELGSRRAFEEDLQHAFDTSNQAIALLHVDLDRFKWVNDTLGHPAGDTVLVTAAKRISIACYKVGKAYRVGGDEFMVIIDEDATSELAMWIGDQIVEAMSTTIKYKNHLAKVGASVGVALSKPGCNSPANLIANADVALYEAKRDGRNRVCEITPKIRERIHAKRRLAGDIQLGLERDEFIPYFQPQIHVGTGAVVGAEALVRWQHPDLGLLSPAAFLDQAAERGLAAEIDRRMLYRSLETAANLKRRGLILPSVSVNISAARLLDPDLPKDVASCWTDRSCKLTIELLETIYFDESQDSVQFGHTLAQLRDMGVRIETDDFGSGRASITGLLKIRPDRLKIDRSLIQAAVNDPVKRSVVAAIIDMTRALGIEALAEGVESENDIEKIRTLGCYIFQGYALSRPLPEDELATYLETRHRPSTRVVGI